MSERTNKGGATSGQKVPKSPKSKFRAKSQQEQTAESKLRMEKSSEELERAIAVSYTHLTLPTICSV